LRSATGWVQLRPDPQAASTEGITVHHHARLSACLLLTALIAPVGCGGGGAPSGFSKGDRWTFPLVGPLEDGVLLAPATVHGKGPYLFAIDPDAGISAIDQQVAADAGLTTSRGPSLLDETGAEAMRAYAELIDHAEVCIGIDEEQVGPLALHRHRRDERPVLERPDQRERPVIALREPGCPRGRTAGEQEGGEQKRFVMHGDPSWGRGRGRENTAGRHRVQA